MLSLHFVFLLAAAAAAAATQVCIDVYHENRIVARVSCVKRW